MKMVGDPGDRPDFLRQLCSIGWIRPSREGQIPFQHPCRLHWRRTADDDDEI